MSNIIYLQLDNEETFAWVTEISHRNHQMFKVSFKNDYENIFYTDVETGKWVEEDLGFTSLAYEVGKQIKIFLKNPIHVPKLLIWHTQHTADDKHISFGFFNFLKGKHKLYEIYNANKKYMYTLVDMDNDEWQILGNSSSIISQIDPLFVEQVIQILPFYSADYK
ncbi:MAG: hypothetical protein ABIP80_00575 [Ferruginibacter sp.]